MSYEIPPINNAFAASKYESVRKNSNRIQSDASVGQSSESAHVSESTQNLQKMWDKINVLPEIRIQKVEQIKEEIKRNNYPLENRLYKAVEKLVKGHIIDIEE